tara:strand:+ start:138 stop:671 length:534 start_codon:yes stop_codon:yes gene_type:complete
MPAFINAAGNNMQARFSWHGENFEKDLKPKLEKGLTDAANVYAKAIRKKLLKTSGAIAWTGGTKLRIKHSKAGQIPFFQTGNLALSVRTSFNFGKTRGRLTKMKARISTDVPYAPTLEFGGALSIDPNKKKYTRIRLINPLKSTPYIAARPVWRPTFFEQKDQMLFALTSRISVLGP